jgi:hypothetical protein
MPCKIRVSGFFILTLVARAAVFGNLHMSPRATQPQTKAQMKTIEIREENVAIQAEEGMTFYKSYNISGRGKLVAKVQGVMTPSKHFDADLITLNDGDYTLRDILSFAQRGMRGLNLV